MIEAPLPKNESERLTALRQLDMLDTPIEERFERIVRLTKTMFGTSMSAFGLIDERRQWQKAIVGDNLQEVPRGATFCAHTILGEDVLVVPDATRDPRFAGNPMVLKDDGVRFYAGCPIRSPSGHNIGSLCVIDSAPRTMTPHEAQSLRDFAALIKKELQEAKTRSVPQIFSAEMTEAKRPHFIDAETRLWNEAGITELMRREWKSATDKHRPLAACLAEFEVNETQMPTIARALLTVLRDGDSLGRRTDGQFLIVAPECGVEHAGGMTDRLRSAAQAAAPDLPMPGFGVTCCQPAAGQDISTLLRRVEGALAIARKSGGKRVVITADADPLGRHRQPAVR